MQAMILAAGFGTRLLPYTEKRPKPLFPILNIPLLLLTIERLKRFGFSRILVNCHHLREQIVQLLDGVDGVVVIEEEEILGTGGGLRGALHLMRDEPLLVTNGDIYHTVDLKQLYQHHCSRENRVTLAMHDFPRFNTVTVAGDEIAGFSGESGQKLAFTGIHVIDPNILEPVIPGFSCIIDRYREMVAERSGEGGRSGLGVMRVDDCFWTDMGTVGDYLQLCGGILQGNLPSWPELEKPLSEVSDQWFCSSGGIYGEDCEFAGWGVVGNATIGKGAKLARCVIWDGAVVGPGETVQDRIIV